MKAQVLKCEFQEHDSNPCVIVHGDYCYSANTLGSPSCFTCWRQPHQTGIPKPKGFDAMIAAYNADQSHH